MTLDSFFAWIIVCAEILILILLLRNRVYRHFPFFFIFLVENLVSDAFLLLLYYKASPATYYHLYVWDMAVGAAFQFAVLIELGVSVLRPIRTSVPKSSWIIIALLIALIALMLWPIARFTVPPGLSHLGNLFVRLQQTISILRVVVFLAMAAFSQFLAIGWRNREMQIASGLGVYSLISLIISILHTHQAVSAQYHGLDEFGIICYLGTLAYWVLSFAKNTVPRREFTPQMEDFLILMGGAVKSGRESVTKMIVTPRPPKENE